MERLTEQLKVFVKKNRTFSLWAAVPPLFHCATATGLGSSAQQQQYIESASHAVGGIELTCVARWNKVTPTLLCQHAGQNSLASSINRAQASLTASRWVEEVVNNHTMLTCGCGCKELESDSSSSSSCDRALCMRRSSAPLTRLELLICFESPMTGGRDTEQLTDS
ncbi:unnamed protein product [Pleuronectes platessa]|uniref:Uncharacterized protein n=1 Tax=Pleuronectes platessa TaxID=8262 RepID=A0A9N7YDQ9_PLEPL|nr:unnamed protein product [Pleuronectes platessa]